MKKKVSNKWTLSLVFIVPIILAIVINVIAAHPWDKVSHGGALAYPPENGTETVSPKVASGSGVIFSGTGFSNGTDHSIQIMSITPDKLPDGVTYKVSGVSQREFGSILYQELEKKPEIHVEQVPFTIKAHSKKYFPVIEFVPNQPGTYTIQGFYINYKSKDKLYKEYYPDQFVIKDVK